MALVFYYNDMLQKVTMQRTQHFELLVVTERTQLNATHAQLLEKLRPIALAETCRFLAIQSLEFQEFHGSLCVGGPSQLRSTTQNLDHF